MIKVVPENRVCVGRKAHAHPIFGLSLSKFDSNS